MIAKLKAKANSKKGFTLAELLIVVAIVAVLVAIAVPTFTSSLTKAQAAVDDANFRTAKVVAAAQEIDTEDIIVGGGEGNYFNADTGEFQKTTTGAYTAKTAGTNPTRAVGNYIIRNGATVTWGTGS